MGLMGRVVLLDELGFFGRLRDKDRRLSGWLRHVAAVRRQMLQTPAEPFEVDVTIDKEHHLFWSVITTNKSQGIGSSIGTQLCCIAKDVMAQGMTFEEQVLELVIDQFGWRVVVTLDFIADHFYLLVDLMLRILAMEHDVSKHIDSMGEVLLGDGGIINGIFLDGEGIQFTSQPFDGIDDLDGITTGSAFKTHVFAEMGQSFLTSCALICPKPFVTGAGGNVIAAIDHLRVGGQMDDAETICKGICVIFCHFVCKFTQNPLIFRGNSKKYSYLCPQSKKRSP